MCKFYLPWKHSESIWSQLDKDWYQNQWKKITDDRGISSWARRKKLTTAFAQSNGNSWAALQWIIDLFHILKFSDLLASKKLWILIFKVTNLKIYKIFILNFWGIYQKKKAVKFHPMLIIREDQKKIKNFFGANVNYFLLFRFSGHGHYQAKKKAAWTEEKTQQSKQL